MASTSPSASAVAHNIGPRGESLTSQRIIKNKQINHDKHPDESNPRTHRLSSHPANINEKQRWQAQQTDRQTDRQAE